MKIEIVPMEARHIPALAVLEQQSFSVPWSEVAFQQELQNSAGLFLVAQQQDIVAGYVGAYLAGEELSMTNIAVSPDYRKQGVGSRLLDALHQSAGRQGIQELFLEVRQSNTAAIRLYQKKGYRQVGIRPGFYRKPKEDGYILSKRLYPAEEEEEQFENISH